LPISSLIIPFFFSVTSLVFRVSPESLKTLPHSVCWFVSRMVLLPFFLLTMRSQEIQGYLPSFFSVFGLLRTINLFPTVISLSFLSSSVIMQLGVRYLLKDWFRPEQPFFRLFFLRCLRNFMSLLFPRTSFPPRPLAAP